MYMNENKGNNINNNHNIPIVVYKAPCEFKFNPIDVKSVPNAN